MARQIVFTNANGDSITLGESPFYLLDLFGFSGIGTSILSESAPFQDGSTYINTNIETRIISFVVVIFGTSILDAESKKRDLIKVFNPKLGQGTLTYSNGNLTKQLTVAIETAPIQPAGEQNRDPNNIRMLVRLEANQPFFEDILETFIQLTDADANFSFPLELPTEIGLLNNSQVQLDNDGDVETPLRIEIPEGVEDPKIENLTTSEFIQINTTIPAGKTMIITTDFNNKKVVLKDNISGVETNASQYVDFASDYFMLIPGGNIIKFTATLGADTSVVSIFYRNRFLGL